MLQCSPCWLSSGSAWKKEEKEKKKRKEERKKEKRKKKEKKREREEKEKRMINCSARLIFKASKSAHITPYSTISTGYQLTAGFNTKYLSSVSTSLICFISTLLLALFAQPRILGSSVFLGWEEGPWERDPFNTSDL